MFRQQMFQISESNLQNNVSDSKMSNNSH